jgi:hypothetical protein
MDITKRRISTGILIALLFRVHYLSPPFRHEREPPSGPGRVHEVGDIDGLERLRMFEQ